MDSQRRTAERSSGGANDCDSYLDSGEEPLWIVAKGSGRDCPSSLALDQFLKTRLPNGDDGNLSPGEDAVQKDENGDNADLEKNGSLRSRT